MTNLPLTTLQCEKKFDSHLLGFVFLMGKLEKNSDVACMHAQSTQSCPTLCDTVACQAPLSMGIFQARTLEWVAMPSSRGSSQPGDRTRISCISCIGRQVVQY